MQRHEDGPEPTPEGGFLRRAYDLDGETGTRAFYADWAEAYEAEVRAKGYATPSRCAAALRAAATDHTAPLLDIGCGTGLSGEAFAEAGFTNVDGTDFTEAMLAVARSKPGVYRRLLPSDAARPVPAAPGDYANMAAVGVIGPGHAPATLIGTAAELLPKGGCFVFSLNDHALEDGSYRRVADDLVASGLVHVVFEEYGDHLPGIDLNAVVLVLRRA